MMWVLYNSRNNYSINRLLCFLFISPKVSCEKFTEKKLSHEYIRISISIGINERDDCIQVLLNIDLLKRDGNVCLSTILTFTKVLPYTKHNRMLRHGFEWNE